MDDRELVARQIGRQPRAFHRVAVRCPFGMPAVTEQEPFGSDGAPFPTTYYLTCRHLVAAVSRIEAAGGVERWSAAVAADPLLRAEVEEGNELQRAVRRELAAGLAADEAGQRLGPGDGAAAGGPAGRRASDRDAAASLELGVGGTRKPEQLKCLHAHVAFALAHPGHGIGGRILAEIPDPWPAERCCSTP